MRIRYPILVFLAGLTLSVLACQRPAPPTPTQPAPTPEVGASVEGDLHRSGPAKRLLVSVIRKRAAAELQANGFKSIGGDPRPLSREEAERLLSHLDDEQILVGAHERGKLGDGTILRRLGAVFEWIVAHKEEIAEIVKWVLSLLVLFADNSP